MASDVRGGRWILAAVLAVAALADGWRFWHAAVHIYYVAAARSMAGDWHAFAFGAFDPRATISVDKLPGGLWVQALSVRIFGLSTPALVLPEVIAGVAAVYALHRAVRRTYGQAAGLVAAAVLAVTPAAVSSVRGDVPDGLCVLLLVLAAGATLRAVDTGRLRDLLLAALWVGLAFQVKMLEAWFVVPGLGLAYLVAAPGRLAVRFRHAVAALGVLLVVSLGWMTAVALTPADQRPYVDGTVHDSVFEQVFVYNGVARFSDQGIYGLRPDYPPNALHSDGPAAPPRTTSTSGALGRLTWHRLVTGPVGRAGGWALPLALCVAGGLLVARWRRPRTDRLRAAAIVWGGWLVPATVALSASQTILAYYIGVLAPPVAALAGIGALSAYRGLAGRRRRWVPIAAAALLLGAAVALCLDGDVPTWVLVAAGTVGAVAVLVAVAGARWPRLVLSGLVAALLAGPTVCTVTLIAAGGTAWDAPYAPHGTLLAQSRAAAGVRGEIPSYGGVVLLATSQTWWDHVDASAAANGMILAGGRYILYFTSATASIDIAGGDRRVIVVGGYTGLIGSPTVAQVETMLDQHNIQLAVTPGEYDWRFADPRLALLRARCTQQNGTDTRVSEIILTCE